MDHLDAMARVVAHHLKPGGRFVTFQMNPSLAREGHYYEPYGIRVNLPPHFSDGQELSFSSRWARIGGRRSRSITGPAKRSPRHCNALD